MTPWVYAKLSEMAKDGDAEASSILERADKEEGQPKFEDDAYRCATGKNAKGRFVKGGVKDRKPKEPAPSAKAVGTAGRMTPAEVYRDCRKAQERVSEVLSRDKGYMDAVRRVDRNAKERGQISISEESMRRAASFFQGNPYLAIGKAGGADTVKRERKCVLIMGPAAAGKSFWIKQQPELREGYAIIDGDLYRNAVPGYVKGPTGQAKPSEYEEYGFAETEGGISEDESRHDYSMVGCTQDVSKAIKKGLYDKYVGEGSNFIWAMVGEDTDGMTEKIQDLVDSGYGVRVVLKNPPYQQTIRGSLTRTRKVPTQVVAAGLRSPMSFRDNMGRFEGNGAVTFEEDNGTYLGEKDMEAYR